jgi:DNA polymerase III epsilon subunit family exonuclease
MEAVGVPKLERVSRDNVKKASLNFVDTETTGLSNKDRIVEICVRKYANGEFKNEFHTFLNPKRKINPHAKRVNRISDVKLRHSPTFRDISHDLVKFMGDDPVVVHNSNFDSRMITSELKRSNARVPRNLKRALEHPIDTMKIHARLHRGRPHNLGSVANQYGLKETQDHRAKSDARLTAKVFYRMTEELRKKRALTRVTLSNMREYQDA